ncbi:MAG: hypothetical protein AUJ72_03160 [Candidatus Omnitrophica bacterium CG1_02_46_14]|nr:MAG: hypothetical protein AUJ72_03160 [Candidatus Omnitrophica bacterium CG1_02_46_14]
MRTNPLDLLEWPDICRLAAENDQVFENFKRNPSYRRVLEHVSAAEGRVYLKAALSQNPDLLRWFDKFRENDKYGNPYTFDYGIYGKFSPTTLRYIKVLSDLKCLFNDLNGFNIDKGSSLQLDTTLFRNCYC